MATAMGNYYLAGFNGGKGMLLGSVLGESYGKVVVIGDGVVGQHAARVATGMGAACFIFGRHEEREATLKTAISPKLNYVLSTAENIQDHIEDADLVVGAVLSPGARAPHIISEAMVKSMQPGSVIVDVSIDQGGCIETSQPTSHSDPVFKKHGVIHYCVTNMPGAYPRTSTIALTNATLPYVRHLADEGLNALYRQPLFGKGVNTHQGWLTNEPVAKALGLMEQFKSFQR
jgi:alanine dehydrogenase